jgi:phage-related protein
MNTSLLEWPSIVLVATAGTRTLVAQNLTDSASNAVGNASASVNQTASELGNNASNTGETLLNQTGEVAKKIIGGAATVLVNIIREIKQGIGAK